MKFTYSYAHDAYVRTIRHCSQFEKARRMSVVGAHRIGRYACLNYSITQVSSFIDEARELSIYLLKMIDYGLFKHIGTAHPRIKDCLSTLEALKVIRKSESGFAINDERVLEAAKRGVPATEARLIYSVLEGEGEKEERTRLANLMIMLVAVSRSEGSLRQAKQEV